MTNNTTIRRLAIALAISIVPLSATWAQEVVGNNITNKALTPTELPQTLLEPTIEQAADTLRLPQFNAIGQPYLGSYPYWGLGGYYGWSLHQGLNVSLGMSVFASFGKHAPSGVGFAQNISAMYAMPINNKLSLAIGGYYGNFNWGNQSFNDAGINAMLGYRFDEHWEGYLYGEKSLMDKPMPQYLLDMTSLGDKIGAAVKYNFSPSVSVTLSVEKHFPTNRQVGIKK